MAETPCEEFVLTERSILICPLPEGHDGPHAYDMEDDDE